MPIHIDPAAASGWPVVDRQFQHSSAGFVSRRDVLRAAVPALVTGFTAISDGLLKWLTQACRFDASPRLAAAA